MEPIRITPDDREHWLRLRRECVITASAVACLVAGHPFTTEFACFQRATGLFDEPIEVTTAMDAGTDAELLMPPRAERLRPGIGLVKNADFFRHPTLRFGGTPDFFDAAGGLWQGKSVRPEIFKTQWQDGPPLWVLLQHQAEYWLTGARSGGVVCLVRDAEFTTHIFDVEAHDGAMDKIARAVKLFQARVESNDPPEPDYERDGSIIEALAPKPNKTRSVDMTGNNELMAACADYVAALDVEKAAAQKKDAARARIVSLISDYGRVTCDRYRIANTLVAGSAGKEVTADMVGQTIGVRKEYRKLTISLEDAA